MSYLVLVLHHPDDYTGVDQIGVYATKEAALVVSESFNAETSWEQAAVVVELPTVFDKMHHLDDQAQQENNHA